MEEIKKCSRCGEMKPTSEFYKNGSYWCRTCCSEYQRILRQNRYKPSGRNKAIKNLGEEAKKLYERARDAVKDAKRRSDKAKLPTFDIDAAFILGLYRDQLGKCAISGIQMCTQKKSPWLLSIDKIDHNGCYTRDNVQLVCWAVNRAKGDLSKEGFMFMCHEVVKRNDYLEREYTQAGGSAELR